MATYLLHAGKDPFSPTRLDGLGFEQTSFMLGRNAGNLLFAYSMYAYLLRAGQSTVHSNMYALHNPEPLDYELINSSYDALVIPAANWISPHMVENLPVMTAHIRKLRIPCVLVGLGVQSSWDYDKTFLGALRQPACEFLSAVSDRCATIGVRGHFTDACMRELGFTNTRVIGCPSFFMQGPALRAEARDTVGETPRYVVNASPEFLQQGLGRFAAEGGVYVAQGDSLELKALLFPEELTCGDCRQLLESWWLLLLKVTGRTEVFLDIEPWAEFLKAFDFCFGTRIHGNILGLLAGVPSLVLTHDSRTREIAEFLELPRLPLRELDRYATVSDLYAACDLSAAKTAYGAYLRNFIAFLDENQLEHVFRDGNVPAFLEKKENPLPSQVRQCADELLLSSLGQTVAEGLEAAAQFNRIRGSRAWRILRILRDARRRLSTIAGGGRGRPGA